jgi:L-asparaginase / beta-aspartyl-peptidase
LIVHGGAWDIPDAAVDRCRAGCRRAYEAGWAVLDGGGTALDAVEAAIVALEDEPVFDAGIGSHLNRAGRVQLDAILMEGSKLGAGAVAAVERIRNPIRLARLLLDAGEPMFLVGAGAEEFAAEQGLPLCRPEELVTASERAAWEQCRRQSHSPLAHFGHSHGTVGAVACDASGHLAAGTSTGGTCCKRPGRVGDSPLIGCGCYADDEAGAASSTGWGEAIMKIVMAKMAVDLLRASQEPQAAAEKCVVVLGERAKGTGGLILIDRRGGIGAAFTTPRMAFAYRDAEGKLVVSP